MNKLKKMTMVYVRVSSTNQNTASQEPDLKRWIQAQGKEIEPVQWFIEKHTGTTMDRPQWNKLYSLIENNMVSRLVVWRLDRLGRTASGLCKLFDELQAHNVRLVSLKDSVDLGTPAGRLLANVLASVAAYETEIRGERVRAGQQTAKAGGKKWGGSDKGKLIKTTLEQVRAIVRMRKEKETIATISKTVGIDRPGIYRIIKRVKQGHIKLQSSK